MSQFFKKFLVEEGIGSSIALAAFGKHPGWDDHVEDLGLETETLNQAKRILYVQGVGGQIDRGAWEKLDPANRTEGFNHIFLWQRAGQYLLGKMWSSSDGKGRTRYPMVICAQCIGTSLGWGLEKVLPRLDEIEQACKNTLSAADVRTILGRARNDLRASLGPAARGEYAPVSFEALTRYIADPGFSADQHGWFRILYQIRNQMAAFHAGQFNPKADASAWRPQQLRVPVAGRFPSESFLLWTRFINSHIDRQVPSLFMLSPGEPYLDIVLGEPTTQEFFCLRAKPSVLPLTTDVPYELDEQFTTQARRALEDFQAGKERSIAAEPEHDENSTGAWSSFTQRWFKGKAPKIFLTLALCAGAAGAATYYLVKSAQPQTRPASGSVTAVSAVKSEKPAVPSTQPVMPASVPMTNPSGAAKPVEVAAVNPTPKTVEKSAPMLPIKPPPAAANPQPLPAVPKPSVPAASQAGPTLVTTTKVLPSANDGRAPPGSVAAVPTPTGIIPEEKPKPETTLAHPASATVQPSTSTSTPQASSGDKLPGHTPFTNSIGMTLVWVRNLPGNAEGGWAGKFETTQREFETIAGGNPSKSKNPGQPVENLTWQEAADFCRKLTAAEKASGSIPPGFVYALPSQAQWDALLGDAKFEDNVTSRAAPRTSPALVGTLGPNQTGLCDLLGNVWEWCADSDSPQNHLAKGGAFDTAKSFSFKIFEPTVARRLPAEARNASVGFRCVIVNE